MKKRGQYRLFVTGPFLLLLAGVVIWKTSQVVDYARVVAKFQDNGKNEPYTQGIPLEEMNLNIYRKYVNIASDGVLVDLVKIIELPCDVHYYEHKEDSEPVLTLERGTEVYAIPPGRNGFDYSTVGYGFECWPDYQKGWRFGQPLVTEADAAFNEMPYYFVKTVELEACVKAFYQENKEHFTYEGVSASQYVVMLTRYIDQCLYRKGAFCSKEMCYSLTPYGQPHK